MSLSEPKEKLNCRLKHNYPLPIILKGGNEIYKFQGLYNGFCVEVTDDEEVRNLVSMGYFGKANLSRSFPNFVNKEKVEILRERQFKRRKHWGGGKTKKVLVVNDSDSDIEINEYLKEITPKYEIDSSNIKEKLFMGLEEAFFLASAVKCLNITHNNNILCDDEIWNLFSKENNLFQENYVVYYYYRSKNWVVKPGIKFGGDFLLYKEGPPFYHASYVVIIDIFNEKLQRINKNYRRSMNSMEILGLNRLCETSGKELLISQVILPSELENISYLNLKDFEIREITLKRWLLKQENS
ncbi:unnamed protein product [Brassicogethes aeneus]|uniref:tRNA-splicing endonuclease subunit Sen2 n=1 Tax=Brassicogethes aeneus TaxID=1431903 RepID=A0A9P0FNA0_BRAAE|nr:unnamed protein product [Brassicogethes aeneus]